MNRLPKRFPWNVPQRGAPARQQVAQVAGSLSGRPLGGRRRIDGRIGQLQLRTHRLQVAARTGKHVMQQHFQRYVVSDPRWREVAPARRAPRTKWPRTPTGAAHAAAPAPALRRSGTPLPSAPPCNREPALNQHRTDTIVSDMACTSVRSALCSSGMSVRAAAQGARAALRCPYAAPRRVRPRRLPISSTRDSERTDSSGCGWNIVITFTASR